jgi:hypothetical protein
VPDAIACGASAAWSRSPPTTPRHGLASRPAASGHRRHRSRQPLQAAPDQQVPLGALLGFIGIEQNDIFKVLTVFSVVGIFPTLVAGWYGMNFHNMPEYGWAYGYQFGITVIVLSTVLPLLWFKWRGWW